MTSRPETLEAQSVADGRVDEEPGRAMRADARRNYDRIIAQAKEVFAREGGQASMEEIAREAGVGIGTLYRHFPRRIDLVEAVYRTDVDQVVETADHAVVELDPWSAVESFLRAFVRYAIGKRTFLNELHEAFEKNPDLKLQSRQRLEAAMQLVMERAQRAGVARTDVSGSDVMALVAPMCTSATLSKEQSDRLLPMVLDGLRVQATATS